jgi:hypothetical protein
MKVFSLSLSFELLRRSRRMIVFSITDKREIENGPSDIDTRL